MFNNAVIPEAKNNSEIFFNVSEKIKEIENNRNQYVKKKRKDLESQKNSSGRADTKALLPTHNSP